MRQYATFAEVKDSAETFELLCAIKQLTYDQIFVIRHFSPTWQDEKVCFDPHTGEEIKMALEIIGVKEQNGTVHHVGYYVSKEHKGKRYVSLPIFREVP